MKEELTTKEARQSVSVTGMRHVLLLGIAGTALAFVVVGLIIGFWH